MRRVRCLTTGLALCWIATASAGPGGHPNAPGHHKLPAPEPLTCPVAAGVLTVSWPLVPNAAAYQLQFSGSLTGVELDGSLFVDVPPLSSPVPSGLSLELRVRALPEPKHLGQPPQAGGPKGEWSEPCLVEVP